MGPHYRSFLIALLLLAAALRFHQVGNVGTQADEGIHVTAAEQIVRREARLYRDLFENRTPGAEWLLAGLFSLTGASVIAGRVLSVGLTLLTVASLATAAREATRPVDGASAHVAGLLAGGLFALAPLPLFWARFTMLEHFATAAAGASVACAMLALSQKRPRRMWFAAGLLAALALIFKQTELPLAVATGSLLLYLLLFRPRLAGRPALWWLAGLALGLLCLLIVLLAQGALLDFFRTLSGAERLAPFSNWSEKSAVLWRWAIRRPHAPLAAIGLAVAVSRRSPHLLLAAAWAGLNLAALLLPPRLDLSPGGFSHYVISPVAALSLLGATGLVTVSTARLRSGYAKTLAAVALLSVLVTVPAWLSDLTRAVGNDQYPQPGFVAEVAIGRAANTITDPDEPIMVMGNAIFYHWARRPPASSFFHFPDYFQDAPIGRVATDDWTRILREQRATLVLVSRLHLEERLPDDLRTALWSHWSPVALFSYPYQRDLFLFRPRPNVEASSAVARFGDQIYLLETDLEALDGRTYLLRLLWQAEEPLMDDYAVFVHVIAPDGQLLAQADGIPAVGFRPTSGWNANEPIFDYHWIELPPGVGPSEIRFRLGLYRPDSSQRLAAFPLQENYVTHDDAIIFLQP